MKIQILLIVLLSLLLFSGCTRLQSESISETEHMSEELVDAHESEVSIEIESTVDYANEHAKVDEHVNSEAYTYTNLSATLYASTSVNVRNLPSLDGEVIGSLSLNQKIDITGKCNETGWYRIDYDGMYGYVSDLYLHETVASNEQDATQYPESTVQNADASSVADEGEVSKLNIAGSTSQIVVVATSGTTATVSLHNKNDDGSWGEIFSTTGHIGRNGIGKKVEGDMKTPTGLYTFTIAFGNSADPGSTIGYTQTDSSYYWVDDSNSVYYNMLVSTNDVSRDWNSAEHISSISLYKYALAISYNQECTPGLGSAIFFHCSGGVATSGCIAIPEKYMTMLLQNLRSDCVIIIDLESNIQDY